MKSYWPFYSRERENKKVLCEQNCFPLQLALCSHRSSDIIRNQNGSSSNQERERKVEFGQLKLHWQPRCSRRRPISTSCRPIFSSEAITSQLARLQVVNIGGLANSFSWFLREREKFCLSCGATNIAQKRREEAIIMMILELPRGSKTIDFCAKLANTNGKLNLEIVSLGQ